MEIRGQYGIIKKINLKYGNKERAENRLEDMFKMK